MDILRCIAILLVLFTHVNEIIGFNSIVEKGLSYAFTRIGVPLFLMLSGALILPRMAQENICIFYKNKIPRFFFLLILFSILTNFVYSIVIKDVSLWESIHIAFRYNALNGHTGIAVHLWYMYTIIGLYIVAPFLAKIVSYSSTKKLVIFFIIILLFEEITNTLKIFGINLSIMRLISVDLMGPYLLYFLFGYIATYKIRSHVKQNIYFLALFLFSVSVQCLLFYFGNINNIKNINNITWYTSSIFIVVSSGTLFLIIKNIPFKHIKIIENISKNSFGIYLIHLIIIYILYPFFKDINNHFYALLSLTLATFIFSNLLINYLKKISIINKLI